jgi:hypothetical protein
MRSRCERLKAIKRAMWMVPTATQVEVFHQDFPTTWHPRHDYFLVSTRDMGAAVAKRLLVEHAKRFPCERACIRYVRRSQLPRPEDPRAGTAEEYVDHVKGVVVCMCD